MSPDVELLLAKNGVIGDAETAQKTINDILASIPTVERSNPENSGLTDNQLVMKFGQRFFDARNAASSAPVPQAASAPKAQKATVAIPASEKKKIVELQNQTMAARRAKANGTHMEKLLADKPYPGTYLKNAPMLKPSTDIKKLEALREKVLPDEQNMANYEAALKAVRNSEPLPIYIPDESKWTPKVVGFNASVPTDNAGAGSEQSRTFTNHSAIAFLAFEITGLIPCAEGELGCRLGSCKMKTDKAGASGAVQTPRLIYYGRKEALKDPNRHEFISKVKMNGNEVVTKEGTVRSELSFKIDSGKKADGTPKTRTVRVSGKTTVPQFERTSAKYADIFGDVTKGGNGCQYPKGEKEKQQYEKNMMDTWYAMLNNADMAYTDAMKDMIEKYNATTAGNPAEDMGL